MAPTAASAMTAAANVAMNSAKAMAEPVIRIRLKAYANQAQRTAWLKPAEVLRDVQAGTKDKVYLPGLMLLEAAALGRGPVVHALLEAGVSIYEADDECNSALLNAAFYAVSQGHRDVCRRHLPIYHAGQDECILKAFLYSAELVA